MATTERMTVDQKKVLQPLLLVPSEEHLGGIIRKLSLIDLS